MQGHGLCYIIGRSIDDYDAKKREVKVDNNKWEPFDGPQKNQNIITDDTLDAREEVIQLRLYRHFIKLLDT